MNDYVIGALIETGKLLSGMLAFWFVVWISGYKIVKKSEVKR